MGGFGFEEKKRRGEARKMKSKETKIRSLDHIRSFQSLICKPRQEKKFFLQLFDGFNNKDGILQTLGKLHKLDF